MQVLIKSVSNWEKVTDKHSQTGLKTVKLHLEWVLSQVNGWRENTEHLHMPKLNKLGAKQDFGEYLESSGTVNLNILYVTLWQTLWNSLYRQQLHNTFTHPFCKAAEVAKFTSQKADKHYINYIKSSGVYYPQYTYVKYFAH